MNHKALAILNPTAGGARSGRLFAALRPVLMRRWPGLVTHETMGPGDAGTRAQAWVAGGERSPILIVGGDGTIHEVVNGLFQEEWKAPIGVIPSGTGNDFARNTGIPLLPRDALARLIAVEPRRLDVGGIWRESSEARPLAVFVNSMSVGISPAANWYAQTMRGWLPGRLRYSAGGIAALLRAPRRRYAVTGNGAAHYEGTPLNITIANGPRFGGGMLISPASLPWDGVLEQVIIGEMGLFRALMALARLARGGHVGMPEVTIQSGIESVTISGFDGAIPFEADGHDFVSEGPLRVRCMPGVLRVLV